MAASQSHLGCWIVSDVVNLAYTGFGDGSRLFLRGKTTINDGFAGVWAFDENSMATHDGYDVIKQSVISAGSPGRWLRGLNNANWTESDSTKAAFIMNKPTIPSTARTTSTWSPSLVGAGATGTQISSTLPSTVRAFVSTSTTSTIGGPATSLVTIKKCATNSATEGDWTTVGSLESDQTITLAIVLQSIQVVKGMISCDLDAGWFVKLVASGTGTHAELFVSGEKTIYG